MIINKNLRIPLIGGFLLYPLLIAVTKGFKSKINFDIERNMI